MSEPTLRVEACIEAAMKRHGMPRIVGKSARIEYFEDVHQDLAPLARELERTLAAERTALLSLAERIRREGMQGVANEIEEIVNAVPAR